MAKLVPVEGNPFEVTGKRLVPVQGNPFESKPIASDILNKGALNMATPEQSSVITSSLTPEQIATSEANAFYSAQTGIQHTNAMTSARINLGYGEGGTAQMALSDEKKATKFGFRDVAKVVAGGVFDSSANVAEAFMDLASPLTAKLAFKRDFKVNKKLLSVMSEEEQRTAWASAKEKHDKLSETNEGLNKIKVDISEISAGVGKSILGMKPKKFEESKELIETELASDDVPFIKRGVGLVATNAPNLIGGINPVTGVAVMYSGERKSMDDQLAAVGIPMEDRRKPSQLYGALSGSIEYAENIGRLGSAFGKGGGGLKKAVVSKLKQAGINVGEEVLQQFLSNVIYNDVVSAYNEKTGSNIELRNITEGGGDAAMGSLAMTTILEALGISVKGLNAAAARATKPTAWSVGEAVAVKKVVDDSEIADEAAFIKDETEKKLYTEMRDNPNPETVDAYNKQAFSLVDKEGKAFKDESIPEGTTDAQEPGAEEAAPAVDPSSIPDTEGWMSDVESMDDLQNINRTRSRVMSKVLTPVREIIGDVSPSMKARVDRWEFDSHQKKKTRTEESQPFLESAMKLSKEDSYAFTAAQLALKNGNFAEAKRILGDEAVDSITQTTEQIADELNEVGYEFNRREGYFPRRVKDLKGLRNHLGKEMGNVIDDAINEQMRKAAEKGYTLSDMEIEKIINNVINGSYRPVGGRKPKSLKQRTIDEITPDLDQFYYDGIESWIMYVNETSDIIETRKLLGKEIKIDGDVVDMNESIGAIVQEIREQEGLNEKDVNALIGALRARLGYRATGKAMSNYRSLTAMTTLGQITNSMTQFGDFTWSFFDSGLYNTFAGAGDVISGSGITTQDLGIDEVSAEFRTPNGLHSAVDTLFKYTGLKAVDKLGKQTLINASFRQYQKMAADGVFTKDKQDKLDALFGADQDQVIEDLKAGRQSKDVELLLFSTLLDWHPTTLSNMPIAYLNHPNGRILYTLKTFTMKQLDNFRRIGTDDLIEGIATKDMALASRGFGRLMRLAGIMLALNIPIDLLKDWITGKDIDLSDTILDNLYKLLGASRYNAIRATRKGQKVSESLLRELFPPFPFFDYPAEDIKTIADNIEKGDDIDLMNLESWNMLPFIGRFIYWRFGKGEKKEQARRESEDKKK